MKQVAILGNPNTGKTSLFNTITGLRHHVGNWPGKTVEKKEGTISYGKEKIKFIDLPGTYSLNSYSKDELLVEEYLDSHPNDIIINIVDASNLERNLYLTTQLLERTNRVIIGLNNNRYAQNNGIIIDETKLKKKLSVPIVKIEAINNTGRNELLEKINKKFNPRKENIKKHKNTEERYKYIEKICKESVVEKKNSKKISDKIDSIITNKYLGLPIFFFIMYLLFHFTYSLATPFMDWIDIFFGFLGNLVTTYLSSAPEWIISLLSDGIINGVGSVVIFLPNIFLLFFFISILEDSGYLARASFIMNRLMNKVGLQGQSFIPLLLGFGCNVPAIMATRTLRNERERILTILINPFMSCSARLVVYILFVGIFFEKYQGLVLFSLYLLGILIALVSGLLLRKTLFRNNPLRFIMELSPYRLPRIKNAIISMSDKGYAFLKNASTIIFTVVILIWFLANIPFGVEYASEQSIIGSVGNFISPIFEPLGFGDWKSSVALIFGFVAKEVVVGTLGTLYGASESGLANLLSDVYTPLSAISFMVFMLIYIPCMATIAVIKRETGSWKWTLFSIGYSLIIAYVMSFIVFQGGVLLGFG